MSQPTADRKPNRLINETSPYLQEHAYNPVDWYPWGQEAFDKAKAENKPIFLSIGYRACHWCHVMGRESFEDEQIARLLNASFISIKVDREERPDLDHIYQSCCQLLTGQGGWPLSVFLTPDLKPFYAGTYFPTHDRYGRPGFNRLLKSLRDLYKEEPERVADSATELTAALTNQDIIDKSTSQAAINDHGIVDKARQFLMRHFDQANGGFGSQPKFPNTPNLGLFLQHGNGDGKSQYVQAALLALRKMASGGVYDHIGGGFHRYSTDARWSIPHFEKMLYDNALLPPLYLAAYQITGDKQYAVVAEETLDYVMREMTNQEGAFYATQDADSEGIEGKFYVWRPGELTEILGKQDALFCAERFGITERGNFEDGTTVVYLAKSLRNAAAVAGIDPTQAHDQIQHCRTKLLQARNRRVPPFRDEKVITGWNGLMASTFAQAGYLLGNSQYVYAAERCVDFLWGVMRFSDSRLRRSWKERPSEQAGFLEDYVFLCRALMDIYQANFQFEYLIKAKELMQICLDLFWDAERGGFYLAEKTKDLIHRPKDAHDQSIPAGNGIAAEVLLRLHSCFPEAGFMTKTETIFAAFAREMEENPWGTATLIGALETYYEGITEVVLAVPSDARHVNNHTTLYDGNAVQAMLAVLRSKYLPHSVVYARADGDQESDVPAPCQGKKSRDNKCTAYVCHRFACAEPVIAPDELLSVLTDNRPAALMPAQL